MTSQLLKNRVCLITGATGGLGQALSLRFAQEGAHLILVGRSMDKLEALDDALAPHTTGEVVLVPCDLREWAKIPYMAGAVYERFGRLDVLLGNAAILGTLGPIYQLPLPVHQEVMDINVTANLELIKSFDPLLRQSTQGSAIFVTSPVTQALTPYWSAYALSKKALEEMVNLYAAETETSAIRVNLVDPGMINTAIAHAAFPGKDKEILKSPASIMDVFVQLAQEGATHHGQRLAA